MGDAGLFGPGSLLWRVNREGVLLLGGGRALILQVAHPLVAAGVAEHSNYRAEPWGRLYRTLDLTTKIVFGDTATADAAAERIWNVHGRVRGTAPEDGGRFAAGTPYDARDPELLMWVHATLVDTSLLVYERYIEPLTEGEKERYYEESKLLGEKYGVPREHQPRSYGEFREYFDGMLAGDRIAVTDALSDVVDATLDPELPLVARPLLVPLRLVTAQMLPAALRDALGISWGPWQERLVAAQRTTVRSLLPLLPSLLREFPEARSAGRRVAASS